MSTAIEFNHISKQYRLGLVSTRTLSHDLNRWWTMNVLRKEDPYLKIGETNDRSTKGNSEYVWALRDIDFKVEQGDVVGIIGKNGAGKSTLLKLLSRVTAPTTGTIRAKGRIASLLEVGTGFHPEMTGRENIFMNGAIMGMTKQEIRAKLDEIVDFSGCERYLDTPVKRYSSGMMVRLGFAVAAHLDPEILVVDEVLAVGDAEFQKKAIGKMQDVSKGEGRTVLFVSHNMASMRALCNNGILLEKGTIAFTGSIDKVISAYLMDKVGNDSIDMLSCAQYCSNTILLESISINGFSGKDIYWAENDSVLCVTLKGTSSRECAIGFEMRLLSKDFFPLAFYSPSHYMGTVERIKEGAFEKNYNIQLPLGMNKGDYYLNFYLSDPGKSYYVKLENQIVLHVEGFPTKAGEVFSYNDGNGFLFIK